MKLTVVRRMGLLLAVAMSGISALDLLQWKQVDRVYDAANFANLNTAPSLRDLDDAYDAVGDMREEMWQFVILTGSAARTELERKIHASRDKAEAALVKYEKEDMDEPLDFYAADKADLYTDRRLITTYEQVQDSAMQMVRNDKRDAARDLLTSSQAIPEQIAASFAAHRKLNIDWGDRQSVEAAHTKSAALALSALVAAITLLVVSGVGIVLVRGLLRQLGGEPQDAAALAANLALGNISGDVTLKPGDTTSLMARMKTLAASMERVASRADTIGKGDLGSEVELLSGHDRLGKAINNMTRMLRAARIEEEQRNWLKSGMNELNGVMRGELELGEISNRVLIYLAERVKAGVGALYLFDADSATLGLTASYAMSNPAPQIGLGRGLSGEAARKKKMLTLSEVPVDYLTIRSGTGSATVGHIVALPLVCAGNLVGVVELGSFHPFQALELDFLERVQETIAVALSVNRSHHLMQLLLARTSEQAEELRMQQEELQQMNEELEERTEMLERQREQHRVREAALLRS